MIKFKGDAGEWVRESWVNEHHYKIIADALKRANALYKRAAFNNKYSERPSKAKQARIDQAQFAIRGVIHELSNVFKEHDRNFTAETEQFFYDEAGLDRLPLTRYWEPSLPFAP